MVRRLTDGGGEGAVVESRGGNRKESAEVCGEGEKREEARRVRIGRKENRGRRREGEKGAIVILHHLRKIKSFLNTHKHSNPTHLPPPPTTLLQNEMERNDWDEVRRDEMERMTSKEDL